jgi:hypothetical protein
LAYGGGEVMGNDKIREEFEAWYLASMVELLGKGVRDQAQKNLAWTRDDGTYVDPALRLALMAWQASREEAEEKYEAARDRKNSITLLQMQRARLLEALQGIEAGSGNSPGANKKYAEARAAIAFVTEKVTP